MKLQELAVKTKPKPGSVPPNPPTAVALPAPGLFALPNPVSEHLPPQVSQHLSESGVFPRLCISSPSLIAKSSYSFPQNSPNPALPTFFLVLPLSQFSFQTQSWRAGCGASRRSCHQFVLFGELMCLWISNSQNMLLLFKVYLLTRLVKKVLFHWRITQVLQCGLAKKNC